MVYNTCIDKDNYSIKIYYNHKLDALFDLPYFITSHILIVIIMLAASIIINATLILLKQYKICKRTKSDFGITAHRQGLGVGPRWVNEWACPCRFLIWKEPFFQSI